MNKRTFLSCLLLSTLPLLAGPDKNSSVVYVQSNSPDGNTVLAFSRDSQGKLTQIGAYPSHGAGVFDLSLNLGPFDSDQELTTNPERTLLFSVNSGSDSIAVFHILPDGSLTDVSGSPFPSGGKNPVSAGLARDTLVAVNKAMDPHNPGGVPNYTSLRFGPGGVVGGVLSSVAVPVGASPTQALISPSERLVFGADFLGGLLRSFLVQPDGSLLQTDVQALPASAGTGTTLPLPLGLWSHPKRPILYVGFVTVNKLGVYTYDPEGRLTFVRTVPNAGQAICWLRTNDEGTRLYTSDTGSNEISVYDISSPLNPVEIQTLKLREPGNSFQIDVDPGGDWLYVVTQRADPSIPLGQGNVLYALKINPETGKLSATGHSSIALPEVPSGIRPQGVVSVQPIARNGSP